MTQESKFKENLSSIQDTFVRLTRESDDKVMDINSQFRQESQKILEASKSIPLPPASQAQAHGAGYLYTNPLFHCEQHREQKLPGTSHGRLPPKGHMAQGHHYDQGPGGPHTI